MDNKKCLKPRTSNAPVFIIFHFFKANESRKRNLGMDDFHLAHTWHLGNSGKIIHQWSFIVETKVFFESGYTNGFKNYYQYQSKITGVMV